jgi:hypothetical protein
MALTLPGLEVEVQTNAGGGTIRPLDGEPSTLPLIGRILKPVLTVRAADQELVRLAPYGEPSESGPLVLGLVVLIVAGLAVYGAVKLVR